MEPSLEIEDGAGRRRIFFGSGLRLGLSDGGLQPLVNGSRSELVTELSLSVDGLWVLTPGTTETQIELNGRPLTEPEPIWPGDRLRIGEATVVVIDRTGEAPEPGSYRRAVDGAMRARREARPRRPKRPVFGLRDARPGPPSLDQLEYSAILRHEDREPLDLSRAVSALIDLLVVAPAVAVAVWLFGTANPYTYPVTVAVALSYFFLCESLSGRTLGKRLTGLQVLRLDGRPLGPNAIAVRTVLRLLDYAPSLYLLGAVTMSITRERRQRLGDLAAGTIVGDARLHPSRQEAPSRRRWLVTAGYPALWLTPAIALAVTIGYLSPRAAFVQQVRDACQAGARAEAALGARATFSQLDRVENAVMRAETRPPIPADAVDLVPRLQDAQRAVTNWRTEIQGDYNGGASRSYIATEFSQLRRQMQETNAIVSSLGLAPCAESTVGTLDQGPAPTYDAPAVSNPGRAQLTTLSLPQGVGPAIAALAPSGRGGVWASAFNGSNPEEDALVHIRPGRSPQIFWMPRDRGDPAGITQGRDGAIWFIEGPRYGVPARIGRLAAGHLHEYLIPGQENTPTQLISGPGGDLWFLDGGNRLERFIPSTRRFSLLRLGSDGDTNQLNSLTDGPDAAVWVTRAGTTVDRISPTGAIKEYTVASRPVGLSNITSGPDGKLWFDYPPKGLASMTASGQVSFYSLPPALAATDTMAASTNAVWFGAGGYAGYRAMLGRAAPGGNPHFYLLPRGWTSGSAMVAAPDGTIWLADNRGQIARWTNKH